MIASLLLLSAYYQLTGTGDQQHLRALSTPTACLACEADIVLPPRCTFECQDAILSGQGTTVVKGHFSAQKLIVEAAFDTWRSHGLPDALLKVSSADARCVRDMCIGDLTVTNLQNGKISKITRISFAEADDVNYQLEAQRALPSLTSVDGMLVTGAIKKKSLSAIYVFRPWLSEAPCDPLEKVRSLAVPAGANDSVYRVIRDESEAMQSADGRTLYWALLLADESSAVSYKIGINDLWAQVVRIDKVTCSSLVTAEH